MENKKQRILFYPCLSSYQTQHHDWKNLCVRFSIGHWKVTEAYSVTDTSDWLGLWNKVSGGWRTTIFWNLVRRTEQLWGSLWLVVYFASDYLYTGRVCSKSGRELAGELFRCGDFLLSLNPRRPRRWAVSYAGCWSLATRGQPGRFVGDVG